MCKLLNLLIAAGLKATIVLAVVHFTKILTLPPDILLFYGILFGVLLVLDLLIAIVMNPFLSGEAVENFLGLEHPELVGRECRVTPNAIGLAYAHKYGRHILERNDLTRDQQFEMIFHQMREDMQRQGIKPPGITDTAGWARIAQKLRLYDYDHYERGDSWSDGSQAGRTFYPKSDI
jgi:hypothetical protein